MSERPDHTEQLLEEICTLLRHLKWIMVAGLAVLIVLLLTLIGLVFFPVLVGLVFATLLIAGPVAYIYYVFVATVKQRETRLATAEQKQVVS